MKSAWFNRRCRFMLLMLVLAGASNDALAVVASGDSSLQMVIVLSRHGVRSPTAAPKSLDDFSDKPWPVWSVSPGYLTPHGKQLMRLMGAWYRAYYVQHGLFTAEDCDASATSYVIADDEERTLESAHGLMDGFAPHCKIDIHVSSKSGADALFSHVFNGATDADRTQALAAVLGRIGNDPKRLALAYAGPLSQMQSILLGCAVESCSAAQLAGKKYLMEQKASVDVGDGDGLVSIKSPLHNASTFAENFFLEYVEGMPMANVAWGRISPTVLGQLLALHAAYTDISLRTPIIAHAYAGHLASRIVATLQQRVHATPNSDAVAPADARMVFLVGHDTNIATLAGIFNMHWMLPEQPIDPTSTGGALVFELRKDEAGQREVVRAFYVSQSMEQMRNSTPLSLQSPPQMAPIYIPGCSDASPTYDCPLDQFARLAAEQN